MGLFYCGNAGLLLHIVFLLFFLLFSAGCGRIGFEKVDSSSGDSGSTVISDSSVNSDTNTVHETNTDITVDSDTTDTDSAGIEMVVDSDSIIDTDSYIFVDNNEAGGWASAALCGSGGTIGGGNGQPTMTVTNQIELENALNADTPLVIRVSGTITSPGRLDNISDKTLIGDSDAEVSGGLSLQDSSNLVFKNIRFSNGGQGMIVDTVELRRTECVWFDHCDFIDGEDGILDIVETADFVTVSWSKLYYTTAFSNMSASLCGNTSDRPEDEGKINITFHHNWWGAGIRSYMPRVRYGKVHVYNNYFFHETVPGDRGQVSCITAGQNSKIRVENNFFENVVNPIIFSDDDSGQVVRSGNELVGTTGDVVERGPGFVPGYAYLLEPAADVKANIVAGAGRQ